MFAAPPLASTTICVNNETGRDDCHDGLAPVPADLCPGLFPGPFKTITKALSVLGTPGYSTSPYQIRVAGRLTPAGAPILYDAANGEVFPLSVTVARVSLRYEAAFSDPITGGGLARAIIEGPDANSGVHTLSFFRDEYALGKCGIDGTGGTPYGFEIRGGEVGLILQASGAAGRMTAELTSIHFSGGAPANPSLTSGNGLNVHSLNGADVSVSIANCRFTSSFPLTAPPAPPAPLNPPGQQAALVFLFGTQTGPGGGQNLDVTMTSCQIEPDPAVVPVPLIARGIEVDYWNQTTGAVSISTLALNGRAAGTVAAPQGISTGIRYYLASSAPALSLTGSTVEDCGVYGLHMLPAFVVGPPASMNPVVAFDSNVFSGNGERAQATGCVPGGPQECFAGAGMSIEIQRAIAGLSSSISGSIFSNQFLGNRVGMVLFQGYAAPTPYPSLLVFGNEIAGTLLTPALADPVILLPYSGTGLLLCADNEAIIGSEVVFDSNRIHDNEGRGVLMLTRPEFGVQTQELSPRFQNDRIWSNGLVAGSLEDGVEIRNAAGLAGGQAAIRPAFQHDTIWGNGLFGVNNMFPSALSRPEIYRSIVWGNNSGGPGSAIDLSGFGFGSGALGVIHSSDFCGAPWPAGSACSGSGVETNPTIANNWNLRVDPAFVNPLADLQLSCNLTACTPPCPLCASACIDVLGATIPLPPFPVPPLDAIGNARPVAIKTPTAIADMGALEKRSCCP